MAREKMICQECNMELNHHAEKLIYPSTPQEVRRMDPTLGGLIEETHTCPGCGKGEARRL